MTAEKYSIGDNAGPYDIADLVTPPTELANSHLDLGSVLMPVVEGGQVTVEMSATHEPEAVYLVTPVGRIGMHAFAAPRTGGQWREVVRELAESLRSDGAQTAIEDGHWGREIIARVPGGSHRFIGVDGPRWMIRCVASGPDESETQLAQLARAVLAETVVRRGTEPFPPRDLLPIVLPQVLAEQVLAAQEQMAADTAAEAGVDAATGGFPSQPLSAAPGATPAGEPAVDDNAVDGNAVDGVAAGDEVVPGGAVAQSAAATVYTDAVATASDTGQETPVTESADPAALHDQAAPQDQAGPQDQAEAPAPSKGSAMSRFRRRRR